MGSPVHEKGRCAHVMKNEDRDCLSLLNAKGGYIEASTCPPLENEPSGREVPVSQ